jgi:hypothetical protein
LEKRCYRRIVLSEQLHTGVLDDEVEDQGYKEGGVKLWRGMRCMGADTGRLISRRGCGGGGRECDQRDFVALHSWRSLDLDSLFYIL